MHSSFDTFLHLCKVVIYNYVCMPIIMLVMIFIILLMKVCCSCYLTFIAQEYEADNFPWAAMCGQAEV